MNIKKTFLLLFLSLFLLKNLTAWNSFQSKSWVFDNGGINVSVNALNFVINPLDTFVGQDSAGDASITFWIDSCGNYNYNLDLNPWSESIICSCSSSSCYCPDTGDFAINCDNNSNSGSCIYSYYIEDGGTCSCSCIPDPTCNGTVASCSACVGGSSRSGNSVYSPVDTSRLDGECLDVVLNSISYDNSIIVNGIKWYKNLSFVLTISDLCNDLDEISNLDTTGYINLPNYSIEQIGTNSFRFEVFSGNLVLEDIYHFLLPLKDNDICEESVDMNFIFSIDHLAPRYVQVSKHPLNSLINSSDDPRFTNLPFYSSLSLNNIFNVSLGNLDIFAVVKGLSYCRFLSQPCFTFHLFDIGSRIRDVTISDEIGLGLPSYSLEDSQVTIDLQGFFESFNAKNITINYQNKDSSMTLQGIDNLNNNNVKIHLIFPFTSPTSLCEINKEINGYTHFRYINCSVEYLGGLAKGGTLFYDIITSGASYSSVDVYLNERAEVVTLNPFLYSQSIGDKGDFLREGLNLGEGVYNNVVLLYFAMDPFSNLENVVDFDQNLLKVTLTPNSLTFNVDNAPPSVTVSSNDIVISSTGSVLNNEDLYSLQIYNLEFLRIPATIYFNCNDPGSGSCIINVTFSDGTVKSLVGGGTLQIDKIISLITVLPYDELGNKADSATLNFITQYSSPNIKISFNKVPSISGGTYYFVEDVDLIVNADLDGDSSKIRKIVIKIGTNTFEYNGSSATLPLTCNFGERCDFYIDILVESILTTVSTKSIKVIIDKNPFKTMLSIVYPEFELKNNIYYISDPNIGVSARCVVDPGIANGIASELKLEICDSSGCQLLYENTGSTNILSAALNTFFTKKEGELVLTCGFKVGTLTYSRIEKINYSIDTDYPKIEYLIINGVDYKNYEQIVISNPNLVINVSLIDEGVGIKKSSLEFLEKRYLFVDKVNIREYVNIDGRYSLILKSEDLFGRTLTEEYDLIINIYPPTLSWQVLSKVGNKVNVRFFCIDFPECYITEVNCNNNSIFSGKTQTVTLSCDINSEGKTIWNVKLKDYENNTYDEGPIIIEGLLKEYEVYTIPQITGNFYCMEASVFPLFIKISNYLAKEKIKIVAVRDRLLEIFPEEVEIKPSSSVSMIAFISCSFSRKVSIPLNITTPSGSFTEKIEFNIQTIKI